MEPPGLEKLKRRKLVVDDEPKVPTVDVETQTDIHLDHCVRSITWIPMPDEIEPVYEEHDGLAERAFDEARQPSSINDVDDVEADDGDADERMWPFYSDRSKLEPRVCADEGLRVLDTRGYSAHARTAMSEATPEETAHDAEQHAAASDWVGMASTAMIVILVVVKMLVQAAWVVHKGFLWRRACSRAPMKLVMPAPPLCEICLVLPDCFLLTLIDIARAPSPLLEV